MALFSTSDSTTANCKCPSFALSAYETAHAQLHSHFRSGHKKVVSNRAHAMMWRNTNVPAWLL